MLAGGEERHVLGHLRCHQFVRVLALLPASLKATIPSTLRLRGYPASVGRGKSGRRTCRGLSRPGRRELSPRSRRVPVCSRLRDHNVIAGFDELIRLHPGGLEGLQEIEEKRSNLIESVRQPGRSPRSRGTSTTPAVRRL